MSGYQNAYVAAFLFLAALCLFIYAVREHFPALPLPWGMLPLSDAARKAYEQLRGTLWGEAAERLNPDKTPDGILDYIGMGIAAEVQVYAKHPPSTKLEPVSEVERKTGSIREGARMLRLRDERRTVLTDLSIKRRDLGVAIKKMKEDDPPHVKHKVQLEGSNHN